MRVSAVGLCGSDRHWLLEGGIGDARLEHPLVLGHEFAGVVVSGRARANASPSIPPSRAARAISVRPGSSTSARPCASPATARPTAPCARSSRGPSTSCIRCRETLTDVEAALAEPLGVALHAFDLGHVRPGAGAGVFGCGPLGLLLVQLLRLAGASPIVATDLLAHRVAAAEELGATHAVLAGELALDEGLEVAFEAAGDDGAVDDAVASLRPGGRLVLVGIPDDDRTSFRASAARRKGLTLLLSRRMRAADLPRALRLAAEGRVDLTRLVSGRYALDDWPDAFAALRERRGLKVVIEP